MQLAKDQEEKRWGLLIARITSKTSPSKNKFPQPEDAANWKVKKAAEASPRSASEEVSF
jgi:hypothetical protein